MSDTVAPFTITAAPGRVRVLFEGHEVADSARALRLEEPGHGPVYYFPRDVDADVVTEPVRKVSPMDPPYSE